MLVLSRKQGEEIRISGEITVRILRMDGRRVRIGIEAPAHMQIVRTPNVPAQIPTEEHAGPPAANEGNVRREIVGR